MKNRIKGPLYFYGIPLPCHQKLSHWSGKFVQWLKTIQCGSSPATDDLQLCVGEVEDHRRQLVEIMRLLRRYCRQDAHKEPIRWLMSVPGIGFVVAVTLYPERISMDRFPSLDKWATSVGLGPAVTSSDEHETNHGLTCRHNRDLRHLLIEAAWVAVRKDPTLVHSFTQLTRRMEKKQAIVRIAKKLLHRIRAVWKQQTCYVMQAVGA